MFVVAQLTLTRPVDAEAASLAADLGVTPFDAGQLLRGGFPALLLRTPERERAALQLARVRERGHDAVAFDEAGVVASEHMPQVRTFTLTPEALVCACPGRPDERVEFADLSALVRATHHTRLDTTTKTTEQQVSVGRIALSGGLVMTRAVTTETKQTSNAREPVLYLFRKTAAPVLFGSTRARYGGLGAEVRPTQQENFERLIAILRERAPGAAYDTRLLGLRVGVREQLASRARGERLASSAGGVDVLAHTVALALSRAAVSPYRTR